MQEGACTQTYAGASGHNCKHGQATTHTHTHVHMYAHTHVRTHSRSLTHSLTLTHLHTPLGCSRVLLDLLLNVHFALLKLLQLSLERFDLGPLLRELILLHAAGACCLLQLLVQHIQCALLLLLTKRVWDGLFALFMLPCQLCIGTASCTCSRH